MFHPATRFQAWLSLMQSATIAAGFIALVFAAGVYVQQIRDDIQAAEAARAVDDVRQAMLLREILKQEQAEQAATIAAAIAARHLAVSPATP